MPAVDDGRINDGRAGMISPEAMLLFCCRYDNDYW